jgi:hypothetical protein
MIMAALADVTQQNGDVMKSTFSFQLHKDD